MVQSTISPSTLFPLDIIDQRLKEFIRLHHLDLLRTIKHQIGKLNDTINIDRFSKQLLVFHLTPEQVFLKDRVLFFYLSI